MHKNKIKACHILDLCSSVVVSPVNRPLYALDCAGRTALIWCHQLQWKHWRKPMEAYALFYWNGEFAYVINEALMYKAMLLPFPSFAAP